jgi:predicted dehydrogenase
VQVGTQQRSGPHWQNAVRRLKGGEIGQVTNVNVWNVWQPNEMGGDLGNPPDRPVPPGVDYDLWLGPAPKRPFNPARFSAPPEAKGVSGFYFFWEYSSGMICAWGVHLFDVVLWAMGNTVKSACANGGIYVLKDARNTPDTAMATFDCGNYVMSYQLRHSNGWQPFGGLQYGDMDHGIEFVGTTGLMHCNRGGFYLYKAVDRGTRKPYYSERSEGGDDTPRHQRNFLDCVRSRQTPNAPPEAGHMAAIPGYLATISYRIGRSVSWDAKNETIPGDADAAKLLTKEYREPWVL